tara:strand:- start:1733 stop:2302 length:570 start_codon:yes stop_codon:yes gene_type:complete
MHILRYGDLPASVWKNGGGITREIARGDHTGRMAWRLSMAEVAQDGAFSDFNGYQRILTVIRGNGMVLHSPDTAMHAPRLVPVTFDGATPIKATLTQGPLEDLNLIFDPLLCTGTVSILADGATIAAGGSDVIAVVCVSGTLALADSDLRQGDCALLGPNTAPIDTADATALVVRLHHRKLISIIPSIM